MKSDHNRTAERALAYLVTVTLAFAANSAILKTSRDPSALLREALDDARSRDPDELNQLLEALGSAAFLSRLDSAQEYLAPPRQLRLAKVMDALMQNPAAQSMLVALTGRRAFTSFEPRQELLIRALAAVRPAPAAAVRFWDRQSAPGSPYLHVTIDALADNLSEPALALLETKLADPKLERDDKIGWMRDAILRHRIDAPMLEAAQRMLMKSLPADLRALLVEALFDYRSEWYLSDQPPRPPDLRAASEAARAELRQIGEFSLKEIRLSNSLRATVQKTLADLPQ